MDATSDVVIYFVGEHIVDVVVVAVIVDDDVVFVIVVVACRFCRHSI